MKYFSLFKPLIIFSCVTNLLMLVAPLHMMQIYDRVLSSGSLETLLYLTLIAILLLGLFGVSEALRGRIAHRISAQFSAQNADFLFDALARQPNGKSKPIDMIKKLTQLQSFLASRVFIGLFDFPFAPLFLLILFVVHWQIGILTIVGAGILVTIAYLNKTNTTQDQKKSNEVKNQSLHFAQAIFDRSEDIKAMGLIPALGERWGRIYSKSLNAQDTAVAGNSFYFGISRSVRMILQVSIMAWGAFLVLSGDMSGGLIFAASIVSGKVLQPIEQVIGGWDAISRAKTDYQELIEFAEALPEQPHQIQQPAPQGVLKAQGVSFAIKGKEESHKLLHQASLTVGPGEICAIVGPSGAGKSTFARILAGAVQPTDGEISLDGCNHTNWPAEQWGQCVGYVAQDIMLFPASLAENIARMDIQPDDERVLAAAQAAGVHDLINSFPDGYQTQLGSGGIRLSGGQKQRIALARALYSDPKVLILDEPNAHLDSAGEKALMSALVRLRDKGTCIILVSQRRSLVKLANKIMTILAGKCTSIKALSQQADSLETKIRTPSHTGKPVVAAKAPLVSKNLELDHIATTPMKAPVARQSARTAGE